MGSYSGVHHYPVPDYVSALRVLSREPQFLIDNAMVVVAVYSLYFVLKFRSS